MRRFAVLAVLCFSFFHHAGAQDSKNITEMLCRKWKLSFLQKESKKENVPTNVPPYYLEFRKDGTMTETDGKKISTGNWNFDSTTNVITVTDERTTKPYTLRNATADELIVTTKFRGILISLGMLPVQ